MKHPAQDSDIIPGGKTAAVAGGLIVATIASVLVAHGIGACTSRELGVEWLPPPHPPIPREVNAMETTVFTTEAQGLDFHRRADTFLQTYGWVDRERGIIHVPIDVAVELYLARQPAEGGSR